MTRTHYERVDGSAMALAWGDASRSRATRFATPQTFFSRVADAKQRAIEAARQIHFDRVVHELPGRGGHG
jgi:hypothetical protein